MGSHSRSVDTMLQSSSTPEPQSNLDIYFFNGSQTSAQMRQLSPNLSPEMSKRHGIPPSHPNNHLSLPKMASSSPSQSHSRSLSQPPIFSLDSLAPLSPWTYGDPSMTSPCDPKSTDVSMQERVVNSYGRSIPSPVNRSNELMVGDSLPPRRGGHRRSSSVNIPLEMHAMIQSSPQSIPIGSRGVWYRSVSRRENSGMEKPIELVKRDSEWNKDGNSNVEGMGERISEGEVGDDLIGAYMNLDNIDTLNSSGTGDKDLDTKTNGGESSDNEAESGVNVNYIGFQGMSSSVSIEKREGVKRNARGDIAPTVRHYRSVSMDSFIGDLHFDDEPKLPLRTQVVQPSPGDCLDGNSKELRLGILSHEFCEAELQKIMANDKLSEIAVSDPKRAKRILANRLSAARSKERKMHYISELEYKVQTLQKEATTLSAQVTMLQRDSARLTNENSELKFHLQAMEQQARLKDASSNTLTEDVQRLKLVIAEHNGEVHLSNCIAQQLLISCQIFQQQQQQPNQPNVYQLHHQQQQ
ncbi:bZIP_1 domain-containing protein [Cephalotus follicularis]|uniref:BZIP_1 domain-containing protein n=1 Tax=Cephalotus follicularis TaxID=3775 RepID=A0A1Q3D926_CEPFO|nr:bZIP_1 domain-containing protein [Cephalotus follicularis]